MKIIILLAIAVSWAVAFPSGLSGLLGGLPILNIFGGGGSCTGGAHKDNSLVCLNNSFYHFYK